MIVVRLRVIGTHGENTMACSENFILKSTLLANLGETYFYCILNNNPTYNAYCAFIVDSETQISVKELGGGTSNWGTKYIDIIGIK